MATHFSILAWRTPWTEEPGRLQSMNPCKVASVVSDSLQPYGLEGDPARLLCPCDSPGTNTGVGCHDLLQGIFLTQGSNLHLSCFLQVCSLPLEPSGKPRPQPMGSQKSRTWLCNKQQKQSQEPLIKVGSDLRFHFARKDCSLNSISKWNNLHNSELYTISVNPPCSSLLSHHLWTQN